jgi:hypothetical protein
MVQPFLETPATEDCHDKWRPKHDTLLTYFLSTQANSSPTSETKSNSPSRRAFSTTPATTPSAFQSGTKTAMRTRASA